MLAAPAEAAVVEEPPKAPTPPPPAGNTHISTVSFAHPLKSKREVNAVLS